MLRRTLRKRLPRGLEDLGTREGPERNGRWYLRAALSTLLLVVVLAYLVWWKVPVSALARELAGADLRWLLAAAAVMVGNRMVMALKWWLILRGEGLRVGWFYVVMVTFVGYFVGRLMPGALGMEAVRVWYLTRDHDLGTVGIASVVIDRATSLAALALVGLLALLAFGIQFPGRKLIIAGCVAVLVGFALATVFAPAVSSWLGAAGREEGGSWIARGRVAAHRTAVAVSAMQGRSAVVAQSMSAGVAAQLVRGFSIYLVFVALGQPQLLAESIAVAPILMVVTMVPLGLSSVAVGAGAMVLLLEPIGVPPAVSLSASLLSDALLLVMVPIGALCLAAGGYWRRGAASAA